MLGRDALTELLRPTVHGLGYELLGIEQQASSGGSLYRLYIDKVDGISIADCERVSRQISDVIEAERAVHGEYTLEVSSPGMDRPIFTLEQMKTHIGEEVALRLRAHINGRRKLAGELLEVCGDEVALRVAGENFTVPYRLVDRARVVPQW